MLFYFDGQPVQIGDMVDFDGEPGTVIEILEDAQRLSAAGLVVPAAGFSTERLGAVYQSPSDRGWESVVLIRRNA
jgi:hypothetical protein